MKEKISRAIETYLDGFQVQLGTVGMATAFEAVYDSGQPGPNIAFMSECDALPDLGHACGHKWL